MARLHGYRYEYKKLSYIQKPDYTTSRITATAAAAAARTAMRRDRKSVV